MLDLSHIDLASLIEQEAHVNLSKAIGTGDRHRRDGSCPFCGGNTRFSVYIAAEPQHYHCWACGEHGDAINFIRDYLNLEFDEACDYLEVDPDDEYEGPLIKKQYIKDDAPPSDSWQKQGMAFCLEAKNALWSEDGKGALQWLRDRGLSNKTIDAAGLGVNFTQSYQSADLWGMPADVWVSSGYVIPWRIEGNLWAINIRRFDEDIAEAIVRGNNPRKYMNVTGGSEGLYGFDTIMPGQPLVMVEGEFNRLMLVQETTYNLAVVATGGAGKARSSKWIKAVSQASPIINAFDYDSGGKTAFFLWKEAVPHIKRLSPWMNDVNEMVLAGLDLDEWLSHVLDDTSLKSGKQSEDAQPFTSKAQFNRAVRQLKEALDTAIAAHPRRSPFFVGEQVETPHGKGLVTWVSESGSRRVVVNCGSKVLSHNYPFSQVSQMQ